jgi:DNA-binding CsgD family transcriptional regulator
LLDAVPQHLASGDPAHAQRLLESMAASLPPGPERAGLLCRIADLGVGHAEGLSLARQALEESGDDPGVAARANVMLAVHTSLTGNREQAAEYARTAASLAERSGDDALVALTIGDLCYRLMILGLPYPRADLERALELERSLPDDALLASQRPSVQLGIILGSTDHPDEARPLLRAEVERLERAGNDSYLISVLFRLADVELRAGNWTEARRLAERSLAIATHGGVSQEELVALVIHAAVHAHLGRHEEAERDAHAALYIAEDIGDRSYGLRASAVLGFVELSRGNPEAALAHLSPAGGDLRRVAMGELSISQVVHNETEALVSLGRLEEAEAVIAFVEEKGRPTQRAWHAAVSARGRALVAAARGDFDAARGHLERALAAHERLPQPFELGRTLLAQGSIERRSRRRGDARAALTRSLEIFDQLGAPSWAQKAAEELARIPGRGPASGELSETERRIADLVAAGLTNKEIAARLYVTVRTVEGNLTRVYSKLGVRSRTELAARLAHET